MQDIVASSARDPFERERTAERLKGSARRGVRRLRERFEDGHRHRAREHGDDGDAEHEEDDEPSDELAAA